MRSYAIASLEDIALWHGRDISHSSVERVIGPDATILLDFMLHRFTELVEKLLVYPERMLQNLNMTNGVIFSQIALLTLIDKGISREDAYAIVQRNAMKSWDSGRNFKYLLLEDGAVAQYLKAEEVDAIFKEENFLKNVDFIFNRIFEQSNE
jgi:adenylosuccinate lyase